MVDRKKGKHGGVRDADSCISGLTIRWVPLVAELRTEEFSIDRVLFPWSKSLLQPYLDEWLSKSAVTGITRTFRAPHSSHMSLIVGTGGLSPGFATILFQQSKQTHFSCFVFTIVISSLIGCAQFKRPVPHSGAESCTKRLKLTEARPSRAS